MGSTKIHSTSFDSIVAGLAARGFVPGAKIMVNGDFAATIMAVTDRGLAVRFDDGSATFVPRNTPGFDRTVFVD